MKAAGASPPAEAPIRVAQNGTFSAVEYLRELFGDAVVDYACVNTDPELASATQVADELIPLFIKHLDDAHGSAVLKAFYQQLSEQRFARMSQQLTGLLQTLGRSLLAR